MHPWVPDLSLVPLVLVPLSTHCLQMVIHPFLAFPMLLQTTLMDVLAGRKTGGRCEGEMLLNGHTKVQATFARVMGYGEIAAEG